MNDNIKLFQSENIKLVDEIERNLLEVKKDPSSSRNYLLKTFGAVHSIEGNALFISSKALADCCRRAEAYLLRQDRSPRVPTEEELGRLLTLVKILRNFFESLNQMEPAGEAEGALFEWINSGETE